MKQQLPRIHSRIADKEANIEANQAELQKLEQGRKDQIAEACRNNVRVERVGGGVKAASSRFGR